MPDSSQKVALITGGASGLGKAIAERLAFDGARVVITDIQADLGQAVASRYGFTFLVQDVSSEDGWSEVMREVQKRHGALNVLVNNAGILNPATRNTVEDSTIDDWKRIFAVNVEGVFLGCRAAIAAMRTGSGGSIINISSMAGILATPTALAYGASKATVRHLTKSIAQHCAQKKLNIRCNSVHPGIVQTPPWDRHLEEQARLRAVSVATLLEEIRLVIPMGELTQPQDVAAAVSFLAGDDSRHITGAQLEIDGGMVHCDTYHMDLLRRRSREAR